jgi:hypothetical protein
MTQQPSQHLRRYPASPRQHRYLRQLALRAGQTFTPPTSMYDASVQIERLKRTPASTRDELAYEHDFLAEENAARAANTDVAIRTDEISGYGSDCRWLQ